MSNTKRSADAAIRAVLWRDPQLWRINEHKNILEAGEIRLAKQFGATWVLCLHTDRGPEIYVKLSRLTTLCIEFAIRGQRIKRRDP